MHSDHLQRKAGILFQKTYCNYTEEFVVVYFFLMTTGGYDEIRFQEVINYFAMKHRSIDCDKNWLLTSMLEQSMFCFKFSVSFN